LASGAANAIVEVMAGRLAKRMASKAKTKKSTIISVGISIIK
jgi:hypothetical protein